MNAKDIVGLGLYFLSIILLWLTAPVTLIMTIVNVWTSVVAGAGIFKLILVCLASLMGIGGGMFALALITAFCATLLIK